MVNLNNKFKKNELVNLYFLLWCQFTVKRKFQFFLLLILMVLASVAEVVSIGAVLPFLGVLLSPEKLYNNSSLNFLIEYANIGNPKDLLLPITIIFSVILFISGLVRMLLHWAQTRLSFAIGADISYSIYKRTLYQPYLIQVSRNSSELIAAISSKANNVVSQSIYPLLTIFSSSLILIMIVLAMLSINSKIALIGFIGFASIYFFVVLFTKNIIANGSKRISTESISVIKALQEGLGGIRDVLIDGTQETYCKIYRDADLPLRRAQASIAIIGGAPRYLIESLGMIIIAALSYTLARNSNEGFTLSIPIIGSMALGAQRLFPALQLIYSNYTSIKGSQSILYDTLKLLQQEYDETSYQDLKSQKFEFNDKIILKNLSFSYNSVSTPVLKNISLSIKKGTRVGFIGSTGSGKSTLIDIIMGLLSPTSGDMYIDDIKIDLKNAKLWQRHLAHVPQFIYLSDTSVLENIAFGIPYENINSEKVKNVAIKAHIDSTISNLEFGYKTVIGERGIKLSGGQRQRIGIARALYKNANVIVFDEATSALDTDTENSIMNSIGALDSNLTILIVAHRVSTLKNCDLIVELDDGKIKRIGSYEQIIIENKK